MHQYNHKLTEFAKTLRKNMTPWERHLWYDFLRKYPVTFQRQRVIGNYIVDFYCEKAKLIIELDGGGHYSPEQIEHDRERTIVLESMGMKVIRFVNTDVSDNFYGVCTVIDSEVKKRVG